MNILAESYNREESGPVWALFHALHDHPIIGSIILIMVFLGWLQTCQDWWRNTSKNWSRPPVLVDHPKTKFGAGEFMVTTGKYLILLGMIGFIVLGSLGVMIISVTGQVGLDATIILPIFSIIMFIIMIVGFYVFKAGKKNSAKDKNKENKLPNANDGKGGSTQPGKDLTSYTMEIKITCPHCQQCIEAPGEVIGTVLSCPTCYKQFHVGRTLPSSGASKERQEQSCSTPTSSYSGAAPRVNNPSPPEESLNKLKFVCASCGQHIWTLIRYAGTISSCPTCGKDVRIPQIKTPGAPSVTAPPPFPAAESIREARTNPRINNLPLKEPLWASISCCISITLMLIFGVLLLISKQSGERLMSEGNAYNAERNDEAPSAAVRYLAGDPGGVDSIEQRDNAFNERASEVTDRIKSNEAAFCIFLAASVVTAVLWASARGILLGQQENLKQGGRK